MANSKMFWKYGVVLACVIVLFVVSINLIMATVHNLITPIIEINKSIDTPYTSPNNLSLEELTQTEKMVEEKREKINTSLVLFRSSYSITTSPGIEQNIGYNNDYYLIQFYGDLASIDKETRDTLEQLGVTLFDYVPNNAFYAKIPLESFDRLGSLVKIKKIRYIGSIPEKAKIGSELLTKAQTNSSDTFRIVVHLFEDVSGEQLATLKRNMRVESFSDTTHFAYGSASGDNIVNICRLNFVKWVEEETPARVLSEYTNQNYIVVFQEMKSEYRNKVLSIEGVEYVKDTTFGTEEYPAIIVSGAKESIEKIREFDFVTDVRQINEAKDLMPKVEPALKDFTMVVILVGIIVILLVFSAIYLRRRKIKK